ncbi:uncharacterized protein LOC144436708 [Glandiceps talaboti]
MVSVPSDFTDGLLVDDRFRNERRAAARRGAANYKNLEALAQKFWKSQDPRMPDVHRKRSVLKPINPTISERSVLVGDSSNAVHSGDHVSGHGYGKPKVRFVGVDSPITTASDSRDSRIKAILPNEHIDDIVLVHRTIDEPPSIEIASKQVRSTSDLFQHTDSTDMSKSHLDVERNQYPEPSSQLQHQLDLESAFQSDIIDLHKLEKKRMRTYRTKATLFHAEYIPEENDNNTSRSSISQLSEISPRTFCNQRRRKINMQFTSNNGQVTVIQTSGKGSRETTLKDDIVKQDDHRDQAIRELVDDMDKDSIKLKRENTVAVLKRIDVILHGPDKPPVASELGSSVKEATFSDSVDFTESEIDIPLFESEEDHEDRTPAPNYDEPLRAVDGNQRKDSHDDSFTTLEDIFNDPILCTKLDVYVKCEEWIERWF